MFTASINGTVSRHTDFRNQDIVLATGDCQWVSLSVSCRTHWFVLLPVFVVLTFWNDAMYTIMVSWPTQDISYFYSLLALMSDEPSLCYSWSTDTGTPPWTYLQSARHSWWETTRAGSPASHPVTRSHGGSDCTAQRSLILSFPQGDVPSG